MSLGLVRDLERRVMNEQGRITRFSQCSFSNSLIFKMYPIYRV